MKKTTLLIALAALLIVPQLAIAEDAAETQKPSEEISAEVEVQARLDAEVKAAESFPADPLREAQNDLVLDLLDGAGTSLVDAKTQLAACSTYSGRSCNPPGSTIQCTSHYCGPTPSFCVCDSITNTWTCLL